MNVSSDVPECLACGACCFSREPRYLRVTGDDYARLGDDAERLVEFVEHRAFMRLEDGHCVALAIDRTKRRFVCKVYATRPEACRALERGSPACEGERLTKGDRPQRRLALMG
jgi:Fe-S-cluster containining protein